MDQREINAELLSFLAAAPTPYHATALLCGRLASAGFTALDSRAAWRVKPHGRYYVTRNGSALIAFTTGSGAYAERGWRMIGAHTDSPCLRLKPNALCYSRGYARLSVEVYGGVLLNPWFDRDLGLAGRVQVRTGAGTIATHLLNVQRAVATIPSLAIHLDRDVNQRRSINAQTDLPALFGRGEFDLPGLLLAELRRHDPKVDADAVLDFELSLYDLQAPALIGWSEEFIASARLDNLVSCNVAVRALIEAGGATEQPLLVVLNDHEEVGSVSTAGARGPFLLDVLRRLAAAHEDYSRAIAASVMVSVDNAHGIHPNFPDKHDDRHGPMLNGGPVIKVNADQRYASNSQTQALFRECCRRAEVPVQTFVSRADMACGSTIGPLTAAQLGVRTLDIGVPQLAMHSIRELCGAADPHHLLRALCAFAALDDTALA